MDNEEITDELSLKRIAKMIDEMGIDLTGDIHSQLAEKYCHGSRSIEISGSTGQKYGTVAELGTDYSGAKLAAVVYDGIELSVGDKLYVQPSPNKADVPTWQPIETAPRHGIEILVYTDKNDARVAYGHRYADKFEWAEYGSGCEIYPTHWMPLPRTPPKDE